MIAINEIRQIAQQMQASGLGDIEISGKDFSLRLKCADEGLFSFSTSREQVTPLAIKATKKGQFWATHPMQQKPALQCGTNVKAGDCLGFLQVGDLMLPIRSPQDGEIISVAVNHGASVGHGRVLYSIRPAVIF